MAASAQKEISVTTVLSKKVDDVLYRLYPRTTTDVVYQGKDTLSELLGDINDLLRGDREDIDEIKSRLKEFFSDTPEDFQTLMDVYNYVNTTEDKVTKINEILTTKVDNTTYQEDQKTITETINTVKENLVQLNNETVTKEEFKENIQNVQQIQQTVEAMKQDVSDVQTQVTQVQQDVTQVEQQVTQVAQQVTEVQQSVVEVKQEVTQNVTETVTAQLQTFMQTEDGDICPDDLMDKGYWLQVVKEDEDGEDSDSSSESSSSTEENA